MYVHTVLGWLHNLIFNYILNRGKDVGGCLQDDTRVMRLLSHHGKGLATSCLTISKDGAYIRGKDRLVHINSYSLQCRH